MFDLETRAAAATEARSVPRASASHLRAISNALAFLGHPVKLILWVAGRRPADLDDPELTVSRAVFDRAICAAVEECGVSSLGARVAAVTPIDAFPALQQLVAKAATVGEALDQFVRYFDGEPSPGTLHVAREGHVVRAIVEPSDDPFTAQYLATLVVHHLRAETEQRLRVSFVSLMSAMDQRDLERVIGCRVRASSSWSGVEISTKDAQMRLRHRNRGGR
jgi:hypothetical protein